MLSRRLLSLAATLLLLLSLAALALWVRSYFKTDELSFRHLEVTSYPQRLHVFVWDSPEAFPVFGSSPAQFGPEWDDLVPRLLSRSGHRELIIPYWLILLVTFPFPIFRISAHLRRRKRTKGFEVSTS